MTVVSSWRPWVRRVMTSAPLLLAVSVSAAQAQTAPVPADLGQKLATGYAAPATAKLAASATALQASLTQWCAQPPAVTAEAVQAAFAATVEAWSGVEFLRFGPLVSENRFERITFWPDPRGVMTRQVQALLAREDLTTLDADWLATQSVAVNGLPALEFVLYRDGGLLQADLPPAARTAQCHYAITASQVLESHTQALAAAWAPQGAFAAQFSAPAADNPLYRSQQEVAGEFVKALSTGLEFAGDAKLKPMLRDATWDDALVRRAPFWRSGLTLRAIEASVDGMLQFYTAAGLTFDDKEQWRDTSLREDLTKLQTQLAAMPASVTVLMQEPEAGRLQLVQVRDLLHSARSRVNSTLAQHLGVTMGFNALDGD